MSIPRDLRGGFRYSDPRRHCRRLRGERGGLRSGGEGKNDGVLEVSKVPELRESGEREREETDGRKWEIPRNCEREKKINFVTPRGEGHVEDCDWWWRLGVCLGAVTLSQILKRGKKRKDRWCCVLVFGVASDFVSFFSLLAKSSTIPLNL